MEIIRLSDKTFKETIKDVELTPHRSTTKEGYISLDPSRPLPHEYEEGRMTRYSNHTAFGRKGGPTAVDIAITTVNEALRFDRSYSFEAEYTTDAMSMLEDEPEVQLRTMYPNESLGLSFLDPGAAADGPLSAAADEEKAEADKVANGGKKTFSAS